MSRITKIISFIILLTAIFIAVSLSLRFSQPENAPLATAGLTASVLESQKLSVEKKYTEVLFVGDIMLDRGVRYFSEKAAGDRANDFVFEKIHSELLSNDLVVANLEGPVTDNESVSVTAKMESPESYFFTFDPSWAKTLFENNIRLVNLGNNHILNFGGKGLAATKNYLKKAGVNYFGAPDYPRIKTTEINGVKITFISYNEFSAYGEIESAAVIEEIQKAKQFSDVIIVFSHWGAEYLSEPAESVENLAHEFIDAGADLVIGSHPHVIQPIEVYKGKRIYYSLGNFIFDQYFSEKTKKGLGAVLKIEKTGDDIKMEFEEINFYTQPNGQTIISDEFMSNEE